MAENETLLKEIREHFSYYEEAWRPIREEARKDMRYVAGDPWEPKERKQREDADRPCLALDELSQYINQLINDPRQNKRAIQVNPRGSGADDKTAELRGNIIREIEYNSRAQAAYTTGFQGAAERSYGFWRVGARYVSDESFDQELYIGRIPNPDTVLFDPNYKELDCSDALGCFVVDLLPKTQFKLRYPKAEITDFTPDQQRLAPQWIHEKDVQIAEYWKVHLKNKKMYLVGPENEPTVLAEDELPPNFDKKRIIREREVEIRTVKQYITNGIEILEENEIPEGVKWIPIIPVFGKEIFVDEGGGSKRKLLSLIRLARDPYMLYCFYRSQEAEEAGLAPKVPVVGYTGQFETHKEQWQTCNKIPYAYLQVDPVLDATGQAVLPLPQRPQFTPNFQGFEIAAEGARRAIQSAMGITQLPTAAQRRNEKSGVALKQIAAEEDRGSFHFIDNYNFALEHTGRILDAWIPYVYDTEREIGIRKADESHHTIRINDPTFEEKGEPVHYDPTKGEHGVTIATGPSFDSQRAEASNFVDTLISNLQALPVAPPQAAKILALAIRLKQLGPLGDEMADIIAPPEQEQQQAQAMAEGQQKAQLQEQIIVKMQQELDKLRLEKAGKVIDNEYAAKMKQLDNDVKVLIAEIQSKAQEQSERFEMFHQFWVENHQAAHEAGMQAQQHAHERDQAAAAQAAEVSAGEGAANPSQEAGQ